MRCVECGKEILENEQFCSFCGTVQQNPTKPHPASLAPTTKHCVKCGKLLSLATTNCYYCGTVQPASSIPASGFTYIPPQPSISSKKELSMKWYYFLIYFYFIVNAIGYLLDSVKSFGYVAGQTTSDLWVADLIFTVFYFGMAIYCLIIRNALAKYKEIGPRLLLSFYIIVVIASVINMFVFSDRLFTAGGETDGMILGTLLTTIVMEIIMCACNAKYFKNRAHLFEY